jgi:ADP-heptose:LPS heptosyltransferase
VVVDLQRNRMSRFVRRLLHPRSFAEFDRFSRKSAGARTEATVENLALGPVPVYLPALSVRDEKRGLEKLKDAEETALRSFVVLNPAGSFSSQNWPIERYAGFASLWLENVDRDARFLILGLPSIQAKADVLQSILGEKLISLAGKTTPAEAFNILRKASCVITEDSGLMHLAWVAHIPVVALFGSTDSVWSRPLGRYSACLDSSDLECGGCMLKQCKYGDVHCLTRYEPERIVDIVRDLIARKREEEGDAVLEKYL